MITPLVILASLLSVAVLGMASRHHHYLRVNAAGCVLRLHLEGQGGPTVVFEAGAGGPLEAWALVQPRVSQFTRTLAYDRAGNGLSPAGPVPRDGRQVANELHAALQAAQLPPPYILVGHSLGGPFIRVFAGLFPKEVAGLVLVDPTQEEMVAWAKARKPPASPSPPRLSDEVDCAPATLAQAHASAVPPGIPVVLISGMGPRSHPRFLTASQKEEISKDIATFWPVKLRFHREWVENRAHGQLLVTERSGHGIPLEEPELIVATIQQMVAQIHSHPSARH